MCAAVINKLFSDNPALVKEVKDKCEANGVELTPAAALEHVAVAKLAAYDKLRLPPSAATLASAEKGEAYYDQMAADIIAKGTSSEALGAGVQAIVELLGGVEFDPAPPVMDDVGEDIE